MNRQSNSDSFLARHQVSLICAALALVTLVLYWPLTHYDFTNVDDPRFVTENPTVQAGLTWAGVKWAFTSVYTEAWQPLTWFSHMLDCEIYGLRPGGHHFTSVLFHIANTLLLFLWLNNLTRATARSAVVAALFAWHPLHVESVAWVCERKDVLSAFFGLLALMAYSRYVRKPGLFTYLPVLALYALGLMCKPSIITWPCIFLLLDFWPFNRCQLLREQQGSPVWAAADKALVKRTAFLLAEKIPFLVLAAASSAVAVYAQRVGGSLVGLSGSPLPIRVENALASYLSYLEKAFWPTDLAYFYPYSPNIPMAAVVAGGLLLTVWTICFLARVRQQPYLVVGWLWFLGALVPTIGLVQFCIQAKADRYTYLPSIGLFLVLVWGLADLFRPRPAYRHLLPAVGGIALAGSLAFSSVQIRYWQNALTVARHAIEVTDNNYVAYEGAGRALMAMRQPTVATNFFEEAVRIQPTWPQGQFNLAITLAALGETNEALEHMALGAQLVSGMPDGHTAYGEMLLRFGKTDEAVRELSEAVRQDPRFPGAQFNLAQALAAAHREAEAIPHFAEAVRQNPDDAEAKQAMASILAAHPELK
jgi:tetratricopeptide (TPR) repeat protein